MKKVNSVAARPSTVSPELRQFHVLTHGVAVWEAVRPQLCNGVVRDQWFCVEGKDFFVWLVFCVLVLEFHNLACNNVDLMHSFAFKNLNNFAFKKQLSI